MISIVTMTRDPHDFDKWLGWHYFAGADEIHVWADSANTVTTVNRAYQNVPVSVRGRLVVELTLKAMGNTTKENQNIIKSLGTTVGAGSTINIMHRQRYYVSQTTSKMQHTGRYIFFIDDDELILHKKMSFNHDANRQSLLDYLVRKLTDTSPVGYMQNYEARTSASASNNDMFRRSTHFETNTRKFHAYTNGKGVAFLGKNSIYGFGPHRFLALNSKGMQYKDKLLNDCKILHCDSMTFAKWRAKFSRAIPSSVNAFPFYKRSANLIKTHHNNNNNILRQAYNKEFFVNNNRTTLHIPIHNMFDYIFGHTVTDLFQEMKISN